MQISSSIMRRILTLNLLVSTCIVAQGHIDHIKNQPYLVNFDKSRCDSNSADASTSRACLNLAFQESDSLLTDVFNEMVKILEESEWEDTKKQKPAFIELQKQWRSFRDKHCGIYSAYFESSASGNTNPQSNRLFRGTRSYAPVSNHPCRERQSLVPGSP